MSLRRSLLSMIEQLLQDMQIIQHQGSGYYSCTPFARRYNKLLAQARTLFTDGHTLIDTFEEIPESEPKDPSDKMKVLQGIRVESGQLTALLRSSEEEPKA